MTYLPPNYNPPPDSGTLTAGVYPDCILVGFKELPKDKAAKFNALAAYIATYRDTHTGNEVDDIIKFGTGRKGSDYYAGLRIERLHALLGLPIPTAGERIDPDTLMAAADGALFCVEMVDTVSNGRTYTNIKDVRADAGVDVAEGF